MVLLNTNKRIYLASKDGTYSELPSWPSCFIESGYWLFTNTKPDKRIFLVFLVPTKYCCSSFIALGATMSSWCNSVPRTAWPIIESLDKGAVIYLLIDHKKQKVSVEAELGEKIETHGQIGREITVKSKRQVLNGTQRVLFSNNVDDYHVSLSPHVSQHRLGKVSKMYSFYKHMLGDYGQGWLDSKNVDSLLIINKTAWHRETSELNLGIETDKSGSIIDYPLQSLISPSESDIAHMRTILANPGSLRTADQAPLAILDGVESLREIERINTNNIAIVLSQSEFNEECEDLLRQFSRFRDDGLMPSLPNCYESIDADIQIMGFTLPNYD